MSQERGNLPFVELEVKVIDGQFSSLLVDFHQVSDAHSQYQVGGFRFNVI